MCRHPRLLFMQRDGRQVFDCALEREERTGVMRGTGFLDSERPHRRPAKRGDVSPALESMPHVGNQRSYVGPTGTPHPEVEPRRVEAPHVEGVHVHPARWRVHGFAPPGRLVRPLASDLDRGVGGRGLLDVANERSEGSPELGLGHCDGGLAHHVAKGIVAES